MSSGPEERRGDGGEGRQTETEERWRGDTDAHTSMTEKALSDLLGVGVNDVRKYIGMLHTHRLVKR